MSIEKSFAVNAGGKSILSSNHGPKHTQVGFSDGARQYDAPTLKLLNPELYKEITRQQR